MRTKLTLTIDNHVINSAKEYASDKVKKMMGVISLPNDFDYKKEWGVLLPKNTSK